MGDLPLGRSFGEHLRETGHWITEINISLMSLTIIVQPPIEKLLRQDEKFKKIFMMR